MEMKAFKMGTGLGFVCAHLILLVQVFILRLAGVDPNIIGYVGIGQTAIVAFWTLWRSMEYRDAERAALKAKQ